VAQWLVGKDGLACTGTTVGKEAMVEVRVYLRAIRQRWWLLMLAVVVSAGVAVLVTVRTPPSYATSMTFFIGTPNHDVVNAYQGSLFSEERTKSYATMLSSDRVAAAISAHPGIDLTPDEVQRRISAQPVPQTVLLQATVTDTSKSRSKLIADALVIQFTQLVQAVEAPPTAGGQVLGPGGGPTVRVEVIAGPRLDPVPVSPRPARNFSLAVLLGLVLGTGAAVLRETTDTSVKSAEVLAEVAGTAVLATVPYSSAVAKNLPISSRTVHSSHAEALRKLRTNLHFVDVDSPVRVVVVTSALQGEGKSVTAVNLAILLAEAGQRVLVIDADLRRPAVAAYLRIEGAVGLTNLLAGQAAADDVIQRWGRNLWVLPSGFLPPNPSELLASQQMANLLETVRERFDIVVVDSPPVLAVTDAAILAARVDGALLVARAAKTSTSQVAGAVRALEAVNARLLGCVFNMAASTKRDGSAYYYHYGRDPGATSSPSGPQPAPEASKSRPAGVPAPRSVPVPTTVQCAPAASSGPGVPATPSGPSVAQVGREATAGESTSATPVQ
jgi:capsular exopolysaccharide synthesis family protein